MIKKILSLLVVIGFTTIGYAQTSYGIKAGVNFPQITTTGGSVSYSSNSATSFYLSGYVDAPLAKNLSIQPGLSLQGKGAKVKAGEFGFSTDVTDRYMYLEIPVNFVYSISAGTGHFLIGAGPYLGFGLSVKTSVGNVSESGSFNEAGMNTVDGGLNFLLGYKLANGFLINGGYGLGLANIAKDADGYSTKNRLFSIGVGFQF